MKPMLAKKYDGQDPTGWWMSEKLNGIRALWNGIEFISKDGNIFKVPEWFKNSLQSDIPLDGEFWCGRNNLEKAISVVQSGYAGDWRATQYMIFESVMPVNFDQRLEIAKSKKYSSHIQIINQVICKGRDHLYRFEDKIINAGGEGVIVRNPESFYIEGRSDTILKLKPYFDDEATVIDYKISRKTGLVASLICQYEDITIKVAGLKLRHKLKPPEIGSVITFSYEGKTRRGIPTSAMYISPRDYE